MRAALALGVCLTVSACGGSEVVPPHPPAAPTTAMDPPPYTPPSRRVASPGEPAGLAVASGFEQARRMALELLEAIRVGDAAVLSRLLDERVARALPFVVATERSKEQVIASLLVESRRRGLDASLALADLVIADRVEIAPLASYLEGAEPPEGLQSTDVVVSLPIAEAGRRLLRRLVPGWNEQGRVIVRVGPTARIVGL